MTNTVALRPGAPLTLEIFLPVAREHGDRLLGLARRADYARGMGISCSDIVNVADCLPSALVQTMRAEIQSALARNTTPKMSAVLVSKLLAAYPRRAAETDADIQGYAALLMDELALHPDWTVAAALPKLWRSSRFKPTVAEVVAAVEAEKSEAHQLLHGLSLMQHCQEKAEREAAEQAKREAEAQRRREEDRKWFADREEAFVAQFAEIGAEPGDFTFVGKQQRPLDRSFPWLGLIEIVKSIPRPPSDPWPRDFGLSLLEAAIIGRACRAAQDDRASYAEVGTVQELFAARDIPAARALANEMAARPIRQREA